MLRCGCRWMRGFDDLTAAVTTPRNKEIGVKSLVGHGRTVESRQTQVHCHLSVSRLKRDFKRGRWLPPIGHPSILARLPGRRRTQTRTLRSMPIFQCHALSLFKILYINSIAGPRNKGQSRIISTCIAKLVAHKHRSTSNCFSPDICSLHSNVNYEYCFRLWWPCIWYAF